MNTNQMNRNSSYQFNSPMSGYSDNQLRDSDGEFYNRVLGWTLLSLASCIAGSMLLGPLVPSGMATTLSFVVLGVLLVTAFVKGLYERIAKPMAIIIPAVLGVTVYGLVSSLISAGMAGIVINALLGTFVIFAVMAFVGWTTKKNMQPLGRTLFFLLLGVIVVSLLNMFVFHMSGLALIISIVSVVIFSIYIIVDLQAVKRRAYGDNPAIYALNIFLDIFNIFVNLLQIFLAFSDD